MMNKIPRDGHLVLPISDPSSWEWRNLDWRKTCWDNLGEKAFQSQGGGWHNPNSTTVRSRLVSAAAAAATASVGGDGEGGSRKSLSSEDLRWEGPGTAVGSIF